MKTLALILAAAVMCSGQEAKRPKILGVAHMALYVNDLAKARAFYKDLLGFDEPFALKRKNGTERIAFIKLNDDQYIELFAEAPRGEGQLNHISFFTDDAGAMRDYLATKGVKVPEKTGKGQTGNTNYNIGDPDGNIVEIVQYEPDSWTAREKGKFISPARISTRMQHIGVLIGPLDPAMKFYRDILGFQETWRGSGSGRQLSWVNMKVPDGSDYLEFMLYNKAPDKDQRGVKNHICLVTPEIEKAVATLKARAAKANYTQPIEVKVGLNRKRQANLFDPDGTRVELMEPDTVDGKPVPSSNAPAPK